MFMCVHMLIGYCTKCVVFVGNLNVTYEYILNMVFKGRLVPLGSLFAACFFLKCI